MGEAAVQYLYKLIRTAWNQKRMPEDWTTAVIVPIHKKQKCNIQANEMKYLRRVPKVTVLDKERNETIRNNLHVDSVNNLIEKKQLGWFGHLRLSNNRQVKKVWEAKQTGKKRLGCPLI